METENRSHEPIPSALLAEVEAMAIAEDRAASEILRDALELYRHDHAKGIPVGPEASVPTEAQKRAAWEAGQRIRERRKFHPMPEGETIKSLIEFGRA